jgi:hypothetical protein
MLMGKNASRSGSPQRTTTRRRKSREEICISSSWLMQIPSGESAPTLSGTSSSSFSHASEKSAAVEQLTHRVPVTGCVSQRTSSSMPLMNVGHGSSAISICGVATLSARQSRQCTIPFAATGGTMLSVDSVLAEPDSRTQTSMFASAGLRSTPRPRRVKFAEPSSSSEVRSPRSRIHFACSGRWSSAFPSGTSVSRASRRAGQIVASAGSNPR